MTYRFGDFELWRERYELRRGAAPVALEPRVFEVLACEALRNGFHHRPWLDVVPGFASLRRDTRVRQILRAAGGVRARSGSRSA